MNEEMKVEVAANDAAEMKEVNAPANTSSVQPEVDNTTEEQPTEPAEGETPPEAPEAPAKGKKKKGKKTDEPEISDEEWAALTYLEKALCTRNGARKRQNSLWKRHFSGTQSKAVLEKACNDFFSDFEEAKPHFEGLLKEIKEQSAADYFKQVAANAADLSTEELEAAIQALQEAKAAKATV